MGRESLQIPVPIILSRFSPSDFLQSFKSYNITFAPSNYQKFELGRHVVNVSINREKSCRKRHNNLTTSTFGICNKFKRFGHGTSKNNRIFRSCDRFDANNSFSDKRESEKDLTRM